MSISKSVNSRRPIERDYLSSLNDVVSLEQWEAICQRAVDDAIAGDPKSRDWLAKWLLGRERMPLAKLVAEEVLTTPESAGDMEIARYHQELSDQQRRADHARSLEPSLHLGPRLSEITN
jgi:hypothetical protein